MEFAMAWKLSWSKEKLPTFVSRHERVAKIVLLLVRKARQRAQIQRIDDLTRCQRRIRQLPRRAFPVVDLAHDLFAQDQE